MSNHNHSCSDGHCHEHEHCSCGHCHSEHNTKSLYVRLIIGAILFVAGFFLPELARKFIFIAAYIILAYDIIINAVKNIPHGHIFDENLLMTVASMGALIIGEQHEAVGLMLFYNIGELLQDYAVNKSRRSITELMDIRPDYANLVVGDDIRKVNPMEVNIGDTIVVYPGEKIPLDGQVIKGSSYLDNQALTGESVPVKTSIGDNVLSGGINTTSPLWICTEKSFSESTASKIIDMVQYAQSKKSKSEKFITKFAKYYTPIVIALAVLVMLIPSIITGDFKTWIYRGLLFLVVSCPCALVVSVPLGFFSGIGLASKCGILVKGSNYIESLAKLDSVVFDKTGTLTKGEFKVVKICSEIDEYELMEVAAYAEYYSSHPIAKSIKSEYGKSLDESLISNYKEISGMGISAVINGKSVLLGNRELISNAPQIDEHGTIIFISIDGIYVGYILIDDVIKEDSKAAISLLNSLSINTVMLTGDTKNSAEFISKKLGIKQYFAQLLPQDKVRCLEKIMDNRDTKSCVAFVGDGINDAPVLARADIGIAMGGLGSDSAIEAADVVLMNDEPSKIITAINISKRTMRIITQNIVFSLGVKILIMILGTLGLANMWLAIVGDVGVALIAILNSLRIFHSKKL